MYGLVPLGDPMRIVSVMLAVLAAFVCSPVSALETPEVYASDFTIKRTVSNIPLTITGKVYLGVDIGMHAPVIRVRAIGSLKDLQQKIPQFIAGANLPKDNCGSYSGNNPVVSLS